jgi:hypothetical protein
MKRLTVEFSAGATEEFITYFSATWKCTEVITRRSGVTAPQDCTAHVEGNIMKLVAIKCDLMTARNGNTVIDDDFL